VALTVGFSKSELYMTHVASAAFQFRTFNGLLDVIRTERLRHLFGTNTQRKTLGIMGHESFSGKSKTCRETIMRTSQALHTVHLKLKRPF